MDRGASMHTEQSRDPSVLLISSRDTAALGAGWCGCHCWWYRLLPLLRNPLQRRAVQLMLAAVVAGW